MKGLCSNSMWRLDNESRWNHVNKNNKSGNQLITAGHQCELNKVNQSLPEICETVEVLQGRIREV